MTKKQAPRQTTDPGSQAVAHDPAIAAAKAAGFNPADLAPEDLSDLRAAAEADAARADDDLPAPEPGPRTLVHEANRSTRLTPSACCWKRVKSSGSARMPTRIRRNCWPGGSIPGPTIPGACARTRWCW